MGAAEDVVAVLDLQLLQIVLDNAQQQPKVRHGEVVLALQIHKVALVCTSRQPQSAGASNLLPSLAASSWHSCTDPCSHACCTRLSAATFESTCGALLTANHAAIMGVLKTVLLMARGVWAISHPTSSPRCS